MISKNRINKYKIPKCFSVEREALSYFFVTRTEIQDAEELLTFAREGVNHLAEAVKESLGHPIQNVSIKDFKEALKSTECAADKNALLSVFKTINEDESQFCLSEVEKLIANSLADLAADSWMHIIRDKLSDSDVTLLEAVTTAHSRRLLLQQIENSRQKTAV